MNESCIVNTAHNKTTKLAVLFVIVGAMIFVLPMLIEIVNAAIEGSARSLEYGLNPDPKFTNVKEVLESGKWVVHPEIVGGGHWIKWATTGSGFFGGNEKGSVEADYGPGRHVKFSFNNPNSGKNTCSYTLTGNVNAIPCKITQGAHATAKYSVTLRNPIPADCLNPHTARHCY